MITQSPIEAKFAAAVMLYDDAIHILPSSDLMAKTWKGSGMAFACAPQVLIERHRVDFCFLADVIFGVPLMVAVECDGYDFHDRTKMQAARDKARDRDLTRSGVTVMRFTGSEIHRDANACFQEVYDYLMDRHSDGVDDLSAGRGGWRTQRGVSA